MSAPRFTPVSGALIDTPAMTAPTRETGTVQDEILRFVVDEIAARHGIAAVGPDEDLIRRGIVDSLGVQEVVAFCEQRFGITIRDADLVPENFTTVERLAAFVERTRATPVGRVGRLRRRRG